MSLNFTLLVTTFLSYIPLMAADVDCAVDMTDPTMTATAIPAQKQWTDQEKTNVFAGVQEQLRLYGVALSKDDVVDDGVLDFSGMLERFSLQKQNIILRILWNISWVQKLDLSYNGLTALPPGLEKFTNLTELKFNKNQLKAVPSEFMQLKKLKKLSFAMNKIQALPDEIGSLTELETLKVYGNQLQTLPQSIGALTKLKNLDFSDNQIQALPDEIGHLIALQSLDASNNQLENLPATISSLAVLDYLDITDNPHFQSGNRSVREWGSVQLQARFGRIVCVDTVENRTIAPITFDGNMPAHQHASSESKAGDDINWSSTTAWFSYGSALFSNESFFSNESLFR